MAENNEATVTLDGVVYNLAEVSENAKAQIASIQFVDSQILQLNNEWAVADTAKIGYTNALKAELEKITEASKAHEPQNQVR